MIEKFLILGLMLLLIVNKSIIAQSELTLTDTSEIFIANGCELIVNNINNSNGKIINNGSTIIKGNIINISGDLFDSTSSGVVILNGTNKQELSGNDTIKFYGSLIIDNEKDTIELTNTSSGCSHSIYGSLQLEDNNKIVLNEFDLNLFANTDPIGVNGNTYIITNDTGKLIRIVNNSNVLFPVGKSTYNPIVLNNSGSSDIYGVRVIDNKPANSGTEHMVDRSWEITENAIGGSDLAVTAQWNSGEELTGFDRSTCALGITPDGGSSYVWASSGSSIGGDPYTRQGTGFSGTGTFAVGDYYHVGLEVNIKVILAAAWNVDNNNMNKTLNTAGLIPLTDPYGVGVTVGSIPDEAVDWVKIELRNSGDHSVVEQSYAKLLGQDGQIIEEDGSHMRFTGTTSGSYYIAIHHRNHLGVVSDITYDIGNNPSIDFTTAQSVAWDNASLTLPATPMKEVETSVFGLWSGDVNDNGVVSYNGADNDRSSVLSVVGVNTPGEIVSDVYSNSDINMDGDVIYNGANSDRSTILTTVGASTPGDVYSEHIPE